VSGKSKIEWTDATWNPSSGCTKVSPGCKNCYAERFAERWRGVKGNAYEQGFDLKLWPERLNWPLTKRKPLRIFVNSMSDLFHEDIPYDFILQVFKVMREADHHIFQVLTKRAERLRRLSRMLPWLRNVWYGVSVENEEYMSRVECLRGTPRPSLRFLSIEPLIGRIPSPDFHSIDWVIVGGESGPRARPMDPEWVREIRDACIEQEVPFFFKQWGGVHKKKTGRTLDDRIWDEMPVNVQVG